MTLIRQTGRDGPHSKYGEWVGTDRARRQWKPPSQYGKQAKGDRALYMTSGSGRTVLAICQDGWDGPRSPYGEWFGMDRARHMASKQVGTHHAGHMAWGSERNALAIWRGVRDGRARHMASGSSKVKLAIWRVDRPRPSSPYGEMVGRARTYMATRPSVGASRMDFPVVGQTFYRLVAGFARISHQRDWVLLA